MVICVDNDGDAGRGGTRGARLVDEELLDIVFPVGEVGEILFSGPGLLVRPPGRKRPLL